MYSALNSIHPAYLHYLINEIKAVHQLASFNYSDEDKAKYMKLHLSYSADINQTEYSAYRNIKKVRKVIEEINLLELHHLIFSIDNHLKAAEKTLKKWYPKFTNGRRTWRRRW